MPDGRDDRSLVTKAREALAKGSKSFSLAALFLNSQQRQSARYLYHWCRYCDDVIDGSSLGFALGCSGAGLSGVTEIRRQTAQAFDLRETDASLPPPFRSLREVVIRNRVPICYAEDLIRGMEKDARHEVVQDERDLEEYCYQVAGTVGLMMCSIIGLKDERALENAVSLGLALQMTNIARDVRDDFDLGRVYLPRTWLLEAGISDPALLFAPESRAALVRVVERLLDRAEGHYRVGFSGIRYLPWRAALAIAIASYTYREIGVRVRARGIRAWDRRVVIGPVAKAWAVARGVAFLVLGFPERWLNRRPVNNNLQVWKWV